jgi:hypothetical protein
LLRLGKAIAIAYILNLTEMIRRSGNHYSTDRGNRGIAPISPVPISGLESDKIHPELAIERDRRAGGSQPIR